VAGRPVVGYLDEQGVVPARATETYAEVELLIENWRWSGVPFRLRTGKALAQDRREIAVRFRNVPHVAFPQTDPATNDLRLTLDPDTIRLGLNVNAPRDPFEVERIELQARLATQDIPAYGRLLLGVLAGDPTFSIRDDEAEEAWRIVEPIRRAWAGGRVPLVEYPAGSSGPPPIRDRAGRGAPTVAQGAATHG
jgi:glucose-6-phosphate 1-dehydrogenase